MAVHAFFAVEVACPIFRRKFMTAVTRDAAELSSRFPITAAGVHLLNLADRCRLVRLSRGRFEEHDPVFAESHPRLEIEFGAASMHDTAASREVTLIADGVAPGIIYTGGIENRIDRVDGNRGRSKTNVVRSWAMASFATD